VAVRSLSSLLDFHACSLIFDTLPRLDLTCGTTSRLPISNPIDCNTCDFLRFFRFKPFPGISEKFSVAVGVYLGLFPTQFEEINVLLANLKGLQTNLDFPVTKGGSRVGLEVLVRLDHHQLFTTNFRAQGRTFLVLRSLRGRYYLGIV
jgi:hypothetical protein